MGSGSEHRIGQIGFDLGHPQPYTRSIDAVSHVGLPRLFCFLELDEAHMMPKQASESFLDTFQRSVQEGTAKE